MKKIVLACLIIALTFALVSCVTPTGGTDKTPDEKTKTYTVNFLTVGGSKVNSVKVEENDVVPKPDDPTKAGYAFDGWYADSEYEIEWDFENDVVVSDLRLYAKWSVAHEHDYSAKVTAPTCTKDGYTTYTCSCGDFYIVEGESARHEYVVTEVVSPDCLNGGYTTFTCENCGVSYDGDEVPPLGHNYSYVTTPPTCVAGGYTTKTCNVCGIATTSNYTNPAGHKYTSEVTNPTCTDGGYTTHNCSVCSHSYTDAITAPHGHKPGAEATCTEAQKCTVCDEVIVKAKGHTPGAAATCTEAQKCTTCGEVLEAAFGHAPQSGKYCHEASTCSVCHITLESLEHSFTDATCQAKKTCTKCGFTEGDIGDHSYVSTTTPPTCTTSGYTTHVCSVCGDRYTDAHVAANGHTAADPVIENNVEATCESDGSYDSVVYCTACEVVISKNTVTVNKLGHQYGDGGICDNCGEDHPDRVTVTYVLMGGVNDPENSTSFIKGNEPTLYNPTHPSGYRFDGWYTDKDFNNSINSLEGVGGSITLYAKWIMLSTPEDSDGIETPVVPF